MQSWGRRILQTCTLTNPPSTVVEGHANITTEFRRLEVPDLYSDEEDDTEDPTDNIEELGDSEDDDESANNLSDHQPRRASAAPPSYPESCTRLGLNPANPVLIPASESSLGVTLKSWQVTGITWMLDQEVSPIKGGVVGDACGLGKTMTALAFLTFAVGHQAVGEYRPTLVLCPSSMIPTWVREISKLGDQLTLVVFYGFASQTASLRQKHATVSKRRDLRQRLESLDPKDAKTARTIVLSSYATWSRRTTEEEKTEPKPERKSRRKQKSTTTDPPATNSTDPPTDPPSANAADPPTTNSTDPSAPTTTDEKDISDDEEEARILARVEEDDPDLSTAVGVLMDMQDEAELQDRGQKSNNKPRPRKKFRSLFTGMFARIIADEGHACKTISTRTHQAVSRLGAEFCWFMTATPMPNRPLDFCGYLTMLYRPVFEAGDDTEETVGDTDGDDPVDEYRRFAGGEAWDPAKPPLHLLSPRRLASLASKGHLTARAGFHALPVLMRLTCLSRDMGDVVPGVPGEDETVIGADIPEGRVMNVEVIFPDRLQKAHHFRWKRLAPKIKQASRNGDQAPSGDVAGVQEVPMKMDFSAFRKLCHLAFSPRLERALRSMRSKTKAVTIPELLCREDMGFALYFNNSCEDVHCLPPPTRGGQAYYLGMDSPKLRYLAKLFRDEGAFDPQNPRRFIVFARWPFVLWVVEMFIDALSLPYVVVRANMTSDQRTAAVQAFTSPESNVQVFLTTYSCGALGLNLHELCSRAVLLEPPPNLGWGFQAIGRVHRLGQKEAQKVWTLTGMHTFDMFVEFNNTRKMLPQVAANLHAGNYDEITRLQTGDGDGKTVERESQLLETLADRELQRLLGQRQSRLPWEDGQDLQLKVRREVVEARRAKKGVTDTPGRLTGPKSVGVVEESPSKQAGLKRLSLNPKKRSRTDDDEAPQLSKKTRFAAGSSRQRPVTTAPSEAVSGGQATTAPTRSTAEEPQSTAPATKAEQSPTPATGDLALPATSDAKVEPDLVAPPTGTEPTSPTHLTEDPALPTTSAAPPSFRNVQTSTLSSALNRSNFPLFDFPRGATPERAPTPDVRSLSPSPGPRDLSPEEQSDFQTLFNGAMDGTTNSPFVRPGDESDGSQLSDHPSLDERDTESPQGGVLGRGRREVFDDTTRATRRSERARNRARPDYRLG